MPPEAESRMDVNVALVTGVEALTHGELLAATAGVADRLSFTPDNEVAVRAPLSDPRALTAGVLAPLYAGATTVFPDDDTVADAAVLAPDRDAPEDRILGVRDVEF
jgi:acyl-CoA synthetase (AMP-forming)/AMP-acid ligase II